MIYGGTNFAVCEEFFEVLDSHITAISSIHEQLAEQLAGGKGKLSASRQLPSLCLPCEVSPWPSKYQDNSTHAQQGYDDLPISR